MSFNDPFHDLVSELRQLIAKFKLMEQNSQKALVTDERINCVNELYLSASDLLDLLRQMMATIEEKGGKVNGQIFSANEIIDRQNILRELAQDLSSMQCFKDVISRRRSLQFASGKCDKQDELATSAGQQPDDFLLGQEHLQHKEALQQDAILDRLTYGLNEIRETGVNINAELDTQNDALLHIENDVTGLQARLRAANTKVDHLLASMSNRGKICTILALIAVVIFLAMFVL